MDKFAFIKNTFDKLDDEFNFITLRNFHLIPDQSSLDNDIDVLVETADYDKVALSMSSFGYSVYFDVGHEYLYGAKPHIHCVNKELDVHFDIVGGLYYRSLNQRNLFIGGNDKLEKRMWENKTGVSECYRYIPSIEDFLVHICCHTVFDKMEITEKYKSLIEEYYKKSDKKIVRDLLSCVFYKATDLVIDKIETGNTQDLVTEYIAFSDY